MAKEEEKEELPVPTDLNELTRLLCRMEAKLGPPWRIEYGPDCRCMGPGCPWCERARVHIEHSFVTEIESRYDGALATTKQQLGEVIKDRAILEIALGNLIIALEDLDPEVAPGELNTQLREAMERARSALHRESTTYVSEQTTVSISTLIAQLQKAGLSTEQARTQIRNRIERGELRLNADMHLTFELTTPKP